MGKSKREERLGQKNVNYQGIEMEIIEYLDGEHMTVRFQDGAVRQHVAYREFCKGNVADYNYSRKMKYENGLVLGVGRLGFGEYNSKNIAYQYWKGMLMRCYAGFDLPAYRDAFVCDEWLNYQNFAKWFSDNYYQVAGCRMQVDKDILYKGNKEYCPDKCLIVPQAINVAVLGKRSDKQCDCPVGVRFHNKHYEARINKFGKQIYIGGFDTVEEATVAYNSEKESYIKELADIYRDRIPQKVYEALYNYKVYIDD